MGSSSQSPKVLIIEDDFVASKLAQMMLEAKGYLVDCVFSGQAAVEKFKEYYDLIILDLGLPDIHGFELAKKIRESHGSLASAQIMVLTAFDTKQSQESKKDLKIKSFFSKPFTLEKCEHMLELANLTCH